MAFVLMLTYGTIGDLPHLLIWAILGITSLFLKIFWVAMIVMVIVSWIAPNSHNPAAELAYQISEPVLAPFRRLVPNLGGLDISPIFAFIARRSSDLRLHRYPGGAVVPDAATGQLRRYAGCAVAPDLIQPGPQRQPLLAAGGSAL